MSKSLYGMTDTFYQLGAIDCFTFIFDERGLRTGYHTMLAASQEGHSSSQRTEELYDSVGENEHLGAHACVTGSTQVEHVQARAGT